MVHSAVVLDNQPELGVDELLPPGGVFGKPLLTWAETPNGAFGRCDTDVELAANHELRGLPNAWRSLARTNAPALHRNAGGLQICLRRLVIEGTE